MTYQEFCGIFLPMKDKIYRYALTILGDKTEAEDVLQDTYEKLWMKRDQLLELENPDGYVFRAVKNLCFDRLKSKDLHEEKISLVQDDFSSLVDVQREEERNMCTIVGKVIATLPDKWRTVIHLRDVEGYEMEEIAKIMNEELPTLRVLLSRARKEVREKMTKIMNYGI